MEKGACFACLPNRREEGKGKERQSLSQSFEAVRSLAPAKGGGPLSHVDWEEKGHSNEKKQPDQGKP